MGITNGINPVEIWLFKPKHLYSDRKRLRETCFLGALCLQSVQNNITIFKIDGNIILLILDVNCNIKKADCERMCSLQLINHISSL